MIAIARPHAPSDARRDSTSTWRRCNAHPPAFAERRRVPAAVPTVVPLPPPVRTVEDEAEEFERWDGMS